MIFTGPAESRAYFEGLHAFIGATLGPVAQQRYRLILGNPDAVADAIVEGLRRVRDERAERDDAYFFNWRLKIGLEFRSRSTLLTKAWRRCSFIPINRCIA